MGQFNSKKKTSIVKIQSGASKRLPAVKDVLDYIMDSSKTSPDLTCTRYLSNTNPLDSWFSFDEDTEPRKDARKYIHGIVSPIPSDEVSEATYMLLAKELMLLIHDYPMIVTIHRDKPKHIHLHFLIHPFNVDTEKRWQQSKKDLREFKIQLNKILEKHGFHPINGYGLNQEDDNSPIYETSIAIQKPSSVSSADSIENIPNQVQTNWNESYDWSHWPTWDIPSARADPAPTLVLESANNTVSNEPNQQDNAAEEIPVNWGFNLADLPTLDASELKWPNSLSSKATITITTCVKNGLRAVKRNYKKGQN